MGDRNRFKGWIKKESTSRPGKFYYFNTKTGERSWENEQGAISSTTKSSQKLPDLLRLSKSGGITKNKKTPAQDRLNNLKQRLAKDQLKAALTETSSTTKLNKNICKLNSGQNVSDQASDKRKQLKEETRVREKNKFCLSKPSTSNKIERNNNSPAASLALHPTPSCKVEGNNSSATAPLALYPPPLALYPSTSSKIERNNNSATAPLALHPPPLALQLPPFVKTEKKNDPGSSISSSLENVQFNNLKRKVAMSPQEGPTKIPKVNMEKTVPKPKDIAPAFKFTQMIVPALSTFVKTLSANDRLKNLRNFLHTQLVPDNLSNGIHSEAAPKTSPSLCEKRNAPTYENIASVAAQNSNNATPMDLDVSDTTINIEIQNIRSSQREEDGTTLGEYYDLIKENLLKRLSETCSQNLLINTNDLYIVIDTNVFLRNLKFLDDLTLQTFSDKGRVVLIVPYVVIQELDRLKQNRNNPISTLAVRAVKYLNSKLTAQCESVKGQSAAESNRKLIPIESADDNIINCCLQIKKSSSRLLMMSNDVNLRNKALINNIKICTKSDLESENFPSCNFS